MDVGMRHVENSTTAVGEQTRLTDLEFGSLLGEGAFARVLNAQDRRNGKDYAVKIVEKKQVQLQGRKSSVMVEKAMLSSLDHPGVVRLHFAFQDDWSLYFVLELISGGELATQIARMGTCTLDFARYYTAETVAILTYLRARRVAHRDLKPENLLLTAEGHLKLIDFDAAVIVPGEGEGDAAAGCSQGQPSFAGTSLYLPPEVLQGTAKPQDAFALDLWALGCVLFLMLVGETPFHAASEYLAFQRILAGDYSFPSGFHPLARELVAALLASRPDERPGLGPEGLAEVERHAFFGGSRGAFAELRRRAPPPRMERSLANAGTDPASPNRSLHSFDFASSAECTPEVGQRFMSRASAAVPVASSLADDAANSPRNDASAAVHEAVATTSAADASPSCRAGKPDEGRNFVLFSAKPSRAQREVALASPVAAPAAHAAPCEPRWRALVSTPGPSWRQWLRELTERRTLLGGEGVALCGSVVQRRLPCLRPRVLVLTDFPRLLVLDTSGLGVVHDIGLKGPAPSHTTVGDGEPSIVVSSPVHFVLNAAGRRFRCCDVQLGAELWSVELKRAQSRMLQHQSQC
mmetsp:Transcript_109726/g.321180  ORF Transcript_109726/g.321180 Transcript_109726/m.321180 type:complete len:578 (-) Transcript_109726:205-1938(-)